jgi:perosamine synthetase
MCSILTNDAKERDALRMHLEKQNIETRPLFYPVHTMPMYSAQYQRHPVAENIGWRGLNLPSYPELKQEEIEYICNTIKEFFKQS